MNLFQKLNYHLKYWYSKEDSNNFNRTIYIYLVNTFCNIISLMHSTNEVIEFCLFVFITKIILFLLFFKTSLLLPSELTETLFTIINDICLSESYEQNINLLIPLLNHLDSQLHDVYSLSNEICDSLSDACSFLTQYDGLINKVSGEKSDESLI